MAARRRYVGYACDLRFDEARRRIALLEAIGDEWNPFIPAWMTRSPAGYVDVSASNAWSTPADGRLVRSGKLRHGPLPTGRKRCRERTVE